MNEVSVELSSTKNLSLLVPNNVNAAEKVPSTINEQLPGVDIEQIRL